MSHVSFFSFIREIRIFRVFFLRQWFVCITMRSQLLVDIVWAMMVFFTANIRCRVVNFEILMLDFTFTFLCWKWQTQVPRRRTDEAGPSAQSSRPPSHFYLQFLLHCLIFELFQIYFSFFLLEMVDPGSEERGRLRGPQPQSCRHPSHFCLQFLLHFLIIELFQIYFYFLLLSISGKSQLLLTQF